MENFNLGCYISFYNDLDFLEHILEGIHTYMNEIVIVDGPFNYCIDNLKSFNLYYNEENKPDRLTVLLDKYKDKIKYYYKHWENEKEKRMFGYEMCTTDLVMLVDSDEFYYIDGNKLKSFIESNYGVVGFEIYNMNRHNVYFDHAHKNIVFKKSMINSHQHLSYTWLVGVDGLEKQKAQLICNNLIGIIYHQTLNRSKEGNIIKYIFYISLYNETHKLPHNRIMNYEISELLNYVSIDEIKTMFSNTKIELINLPSSKKLYKLESSLINLDHYENHHKHGYFTPNRKIIKNLDQYYYIDSDMIIDNELNMFIETENIKKFNIELIEITLGKDYYIHKSTEYNVNNENITNVSYKINHNDCLNYVIKINVDTHSHMIGLIKNINVSIKHKNIKTVLPFGEE